MKRCEIKQMIDEICKPNSYYQFEEDTAVPPPFCVYYFPNDGFFFADDSNMVRIGHLVIELYTRHKSFTLDRKAERVLQEHGLTFTTDETYIKDERLYMSAYYADVIIEDDIQEEQDVYDS